MEIYTTGTDTSVSSVREQQQNNNSRNIQFVSQYDRVWRAFLTIKWTSCTVTFKHFVTSQIFIQWNFIGREWNWTHSYYRKAPLIVPRFYSENKPQLLFYFPKPQTRVKRTF